MFTCCGGGATAGVEGGGGAADVDKRVGCDLEPVLCRPEVDVSRFDLPVRRNILLLLLLYRRGLYSSVR